MTSLELNIRRLVLIVGLLWISPLNVLLAYLLKTANNGKTSILIGSTFDVIFVPLSEIKPSSSV